MRKFWIIHEIPFLAPQNILKEPLFDKIRNYVNAFFRKVNVFLCVLVAQTNKSFARQDKNREKLRNLNVFKQEKLLLSKPKILIIRRR